MTQLSGKAFETVYPFYDWLIVHIPWFVKLTDEQLAAQAEQPTEAAFATAKGASGMP